MPFVPFVPFVFFVFFVFKFSGAFPNFAGTA